MTILATTGYGLENLSSVQQFWDKITLFVQEAKKGGADCLLLPEYAGMDWVFLHQGVGLEQIVNAQESLEDYLKGFQTLAREYDIYIAPGSIFVQSSDHHYRNRCYFFSPEGTFAFQDKMVLTPCERQEGYIQGGDQQSVFKTRFGTVGIAICYDCEFHSITYPLIAAGADYLLLPSYTDTSHGYHRVHLAARARAMENQCFVVHAVALSKVDKSPFFDGEALGYPGIYGPVDGNFPHDGILIQAPSMSKNAIYKASCPLIHLETVRHSGQVHNYKDQIYVNQLTPSLNTIEM